MQRLTLAYLTQCRRGSGVFDPVGHFHLSNGARLERIDVAADLSAHRPATTTVYASWLMLLMWGLAFTGVLIAWAVVIWQVELPMWVFGYFVGVLFALPPLRDSLPGRPPPGTVFDFVSFYWSITLVGITLILLLVMWIRRARWEIRHRHRGPD